MNDATECWYEIYGNWISGNRPYVRKKLLKLRRVDICAVINAGLNDWACDAENEMRAVKIVREILTYIEATRK